MRQKMSHFIVQWISAAAALASTPSMACSLVPPAPMVLKQMMAKEIAYRLGVKVEKIRLDDITVPELHQPFELGADCSGLWAYHHTSGFNIVLPPAQKPKFDVKRIGLGGDPTYRTGVGAAGRYRSRIAGGFYGPVGLYGRWPGAGVRPNYWRAPKPQSPVPGVPGDIDYSGYMRWPNYPTEAQMLASSYRQAEHAYQYGTQYGNEILGAFQAESTPMRWPEYEREPPFYRPPSSQDALAPTEAVDVAQAGSERTGLTGTGMAGGMGNGVGGGMGVFYAYQPQKDLCTYEGVAVILGYGETNPVAVNLMNSCDTPGVIEPGEDSN